MRFEWDARKADANLAKHGVSFESVREFDWSQAIIRRDDRRDYGEVRWIALAPIRNRIHVLVFTLRSGRVRVISLRKANRREQNAWKQAQDR